MRDGDAALSGSDTCALVTSNEYIYINNFLREDNTYGSVDIVSMTFEVKEPATAVCYLDNSLGEDLFPDGVRRPFLLCLWNLSQCTSVRLNDS